jgi:hypothetical protein
MLMFLIAFYPTSHSPSSNPHDFPLLPPLPSTPFFYSKWQINPWFHKLRCAWIVFFCSLWFYRILELGLLLWREWLLDAIVNDCCNVGNQSSALWIMAIKNESRNYVDWEPWSYKYNSYSLQFLLVWTPCLMHRCVCIWQYILQNYNYKLHFQNLSIYHISHVFIGTLAAENLDVCTACDPWNSNIQLTMVKDRRQQIYLNVV